MEIYGRKTMARRVAKLILNGDVLSNFICVGVSNRWFQVKAGIPADAKCVGRGYDIATDQFYILFEHVSFQEVQEGYVIPPVPQNCEPRIGCLSGIRYDTKANQFVVEASWPNPVRVESPADAPHIATG